MNENDELLEERLALLMAGEPVEVCVAGLAMEEAELIRNAAAIHAASIPTPSDTAVAAQRDLIFETARQKLSYPVKDAPSTWFTNLQTFLHWLQTNREVGLGFAFVLLVIFFFAWFGFRGDAGMRTAEITKPFPTIMESDPAEAGSAAAVDTSAEQVAPVTALEAAEASEAPAMAGNDGNNQVYIPVLSSHLLRGPEQAAVHNIRGLVEIQTPDSSWTAVTTNTNIPAGSRLRTAAYSSLTLSFYDGSQAMVGPQTELSLDQLNAQPPQVGFRTIVMTQWNGSSDHQVQFRHDSGSLYEVKSPTGSGIARGTEFRVDVEADGRVQYTVYEGKVDVTNRSRTVHVIAGQTTTFTETDPPEPPAFLISGTGIVTEMGEAWIIAGQPFIVVDSTQINGDPQIGDRVHVEGHLNSEGDPVADTIVKVAETDTDEFALTGEVEEMMADAWFVSGQMISITPETEIPAGVQIGDTVYVMGTIQQPDGSLIATQIQIVATEAGLPFEFTGIVQDISPAEWLISGITIALDGTTEVDAEIAVGDTVKVEGMIEDDTWLAHEIKLVEQEQATFSFTGEVMNLSPWQVAGISFEVADWALIEPGIEVGDRVRVEGLILEDGSWLAEEITLLHAGLLQIVFVGEVDSLDPWIINGLPIQTDEETVIDDGIIEGDLVQVTVWILEDGSWLASYIQLLDVETGAGCVSLTAVVTGINGDEIILSNGQTIILSQDLVIEGELTTGTVILLVACVAEDGTIEIVSITVIYDPTEIPPTPPPPPDDDGDEEMGDKVTICHKPGTPAEQTKTIPRPALGGHLGHGDTLGACD